MKNDLMLQDLLNAYGFNSLRELEEYIDYLEEVKLDYEYIKSKLKCLTNEIDKLY